jgi:hypothetical protein
VENLRKRPNSDVPEIVTLIGYLYEDTKEKIVTCDDKDVARLRGEASGLKRLKDMLTRPSLQTPAKQK